MRVRTFALALSLVLTSACVSSGRYDAAVADAEKQKHESDALIAQLRRDLEAAKKASADRDKKLAAMSASKNDLQRQLDEATALNQQLRAELQALGKDVDALLQKKGALSVALEDAKVRLEELRKAQAAAEKRALLFAELAQKLKKMVDAGELDVVIREGRMVLRMPNDVLFDSGKAVVKSAGRDTIDQVAVVLRTVDGRRFQVAGHTDDEPIKLSPFASNWELSTARALAVVDLLIARGMKPATLSAAGYGQFDPIASNQNSGGRAKNRRIDITVQPNIEELVGITTNTPL